MDMGIGRCGPVLYAVQNTVVEAHSHAHGHGEALKKVCGLRGYAPEEAQIRDPDEVRSSR